MLNNNNNNNNNNKSLTIASAHEDMELNFHIFLGT